MNTNISFYIVEPSSLTSMSSRRNPSQYSHPPPRVHDYVTYIVRYPVHNFINHHKVLFVHATFLNKISSENEPRIFQKANLQVVWRQVMKEELKDLDDNITWSVV